MDEKPQTLRKEIARALEEGAMDLREISQLFRIREKEALEWAEATFRDMSHEEA